MEDNLKKILEEFENLKGQFVLTAACETERLIGIGEDADDWYYITFDGKTIKWQSCAVRIIPLKGYLREEDYNYIVDISKYNHIDQLDLQTNGNMNLFLEGIDDYIFNHLSENDKIISGLYWELT